MIGCRGNRKKLYKTKMTSAMSLDVLHCHGTRDINKVKFLETLKLAELAVEKHFSGIYSIKRSCQIMTPTDAKLDPIFAVKTAQ